MFISTGLYPNLAL